MGDRIRATARGLSFVVSRRARLLVISTVVLLMSLASSDGAALAKERTRSQPSVAVSVSVASFKLAVRVSTRPRADCLLKVTSRRKSTTFPPYRTSPKGRATISWAIPTNAPTGRWSFAVKCTKAGRTRVGRTSVLIFIGKSNGQGELTAPGSIELSDGATLGGKGGGPSPCAPVEGGGQQCFPSDPFNFYRDPYVGADIGQCTWYAVGRRPDLGGITTGNAYQFLSQAQAHGVPTGTAPVAGAVAVNTTYRDRSGTLLGHVAYVDSVSPDGKTLVVDEANVVPLTITLKVPVPASEFQGYIYGGPAGNGPSSGGSSGGAGTSAPPVIGDHYVYYVGSDNAIYVWFWNGASWNDDDLGGVAAPNSSPSAYTGPNGNHYVYYVGSDGAIHIWFWNGSQWLNQDLGGSVEAGTSPAAYIGSNGNHYVYYVGSDGAIHIWFWNGSQWLNQDLGGSVAAGTRPSAYTN